MNDMGISLWVSRDKIDLSKPYKQLPIRRIMKNTQGTKLDIKRQDVHIHNI